MGGIGNQFKDVRIFKNQIFNLIRNFMAGIKLKAQGLGVDGILRIPSIDARDARTPAGGKGGGSRKRIAFSSKPKLVRERVGRKGGKFSDNLG